MNEKIIKTDLSQCVPFNVDQIDQLEVFNLSTESFTKCEHWGWNNEGENGQPYYDFGLIGDFHFDIYKDSVRFYYGDTPQYGVLSWESKELVFLPVGCVHHPEGFICFGYFNFEHTYKRPQTLYEFTAYIAEFYGRIKYHREYLQNSI